MSDEYLAIGFADVESPAQERLLCGLVVVATSTAYTLVGQKLS
jgi:hypothetical protein